MAITRASITARRFGIKNGREAVEVSGSLRSSGRKPLRRLSLRTEVSSCESGLQIALDRLADVFAPGSTTAQ